MAQFKKAAVKIEAFKYPVAMDPSYADKTMKLLEDAMLQIFTHNTSGLSYEELYRNAYYMVLHKHGDRLYAGVIATLSTQLKKVAAQIESAQGLPFLRELKQKWDEHLKSTQLIRDIFMYMDRNYVDSKKKTPIAALGLELWRDLVVRCPAIATRLRGLLADLVKRERSGELIDRSLVKGIVTMLVDLGPAVYADDFEAHYLAAAAEHYRAEAAEAIGSCDCPEYIARAERRLAEEGERCRHYLDASTEPKITRVLETELVANNMRILVEMEHSGLVPLLRADRYEHLSRLYHLFKRVDGGLALLRQGMGDFIKETGRALMQDQERLREPVAFVQALLDERDKYDAIIAQAFGDDKSFRNALNQAFEHFINTNNRSPEYVSLFIDDKLRRGASSSSEADTEAVLDKTMALFRYLQEKDVFEKYYKQHLAKRLLGGRASSDDAERSMLTKLKTECGYQFTGKLESMFNDIKMSRDTMQDFNAKLREQGIVLPVELSVQVLTTGSWPTQASQQCALPRQLEAACAHFQRIYLAAHSGRRLTWQTNMGTADLKAAFGDKRHELNVSTHQMCVLLLFNEADSLAYGEIAEATQIPAAELKRALQSLSLVKGKNVLRKEPASKEVADSDVFHFNDRFTSKLFKVKIGTVTAQREGEVEKQETRHKVEEDRKPQIEAAIVRILKARRVLDHNSIIAEVTKQMSARFVPNPALIKKRIESLIEREFIERDPEDRKLYRYVA